MTMRIYSSFKQNEMQSICIESRNMDYQYRGVHKIREALLGIF